MKTRLKNDVENLIQVSNRLEGSKEDKKTLKAIQRRIEETVDEFERFEDKRFNTFKAVKKEWERKKENHYKDIEKKLEEVKEAHRALKAKKDKIISLIIND